MLKAADGFVDLARDHQHFGQVAVRFGTAGHQGNQLLVAQQSLVALPLDPQQIGQIVIGLGQVGLERHGPLVVAPRFLELLLKRQHAPQLVVQLGDFRPDGQQLPVSDDRFGKPAGPLVTPGLGQQLIQRARRTGGWVDRRHQYRLLASREPTRL